MVKIYKSFFIVFLLSFGFSFAQKPVSSFSLSSIRGGSPFSLKPNNTSTNASVYIWNFGDGNTSNAFQPINTFLKPGTYTISLLAIGGSGLKDSSYSEKKITVVPNPVANFSVNVQSNCLNDNLYEFKNLSLDASSFTWDFGDGFTDTVPNPKHKYTVDGTYNVRLLVRNEFGMADLKIMLSCATVFNPPVAIFSVDSVLGCNLNHNFHFINQSLSSESYLWSFGDGTVSSLKNATHLYAKEGVYTVSLVVTDSNHCSDKMVKSDYIIASSPHSPFVKASLQQGCAPLKVAFSGTSEKAVSWLWDFGNGKTSTLQNPEYVYDSAGIFDVRVSILDGKNCPSSLGLPGFIKSQKNTVSANFTNATHQGCSPLTVLFNNQSLQGDSWLWDFGDGSQSTFKNPSHTYIKTGDFKVQLTSYSKENCSAKFIANGPIMVFLPKASFQMNQSPGCAPYLASFKNTSALAQKYVWRFGDGDSSLDENPTHTYLAPGDYSVTLIAINNSGCADTMKAASFIHVVNPGANYTSSTPIKGCAPLSASFSDNTPGASAWQWKFGDGGSSTERQPTHLYTKDGLYKVSLLMHISGGCTQSFPMFRTVQVFNGVANFNVTQSECSAPYEAVFKDSSLNASSWLWDFGDSTSSTVQNPVHTYKNKGAYSVKLQTKTKEGCESTLVESNALFFVDCGPPPGPGDTGLPPSAGPPLSAGTGITLVKIGNIPLVQIPSIKGCAPLRVSFHSPKKDYVAYIWDFGDGNFSKSEFPVHVYMKRGKYDVKLMGKAVKGNWDTLVFPGYVSLSATLPSFAIVKESNCDNNSIFIKDSTIGAGVYLWDFGDGSTSMLSSPKHVYARSQNNLTVSVKIADLLGCPGSASKSFFLGNDVPLLSASKQNICLGEEVQFFCSSFNYGSFLWDFGDGEVSTEKFPKHLFKKRGMYSVQILMKDEKGCSHIFKLNETTRVYDSKVGFTYSLRKGCNSLTVDFVNQQKSPDAYETQKYLWNFGDGSTSSKNEESHVYAAAGTYTISLTGFSENGCSTLVSKTINVFPSTIADFSFSQDKSCLPVKTSFNNRSTANCVSYQWEFGDGAISKERTPAHLFNQVPNGIIKLTVTDSLGCIVTTSKPGITLFKASFKVSEAMACQGQNIVFKNETEKAIGWSWSFGDGAISKTENPIHAYTNNGEFKARLIAEDNEGCIDTSISAVSIPEIKADFTSPTPTACAPSLVNFNTNSINAIKYDWDFGDGTGSVSSRPSHIYNVPGFYSIRLIVKNEAGCNDTLTRHNYVHVVGPIPSFTVSRKEGCFSFDVNFTNLSQGAKKYTWNFGDGYTSEKSSPVHQYKNEGDHAVTLIVSDSIGCQAHFTLAEPIKVYPGPKFNVVTTDSVGCFPLTVVFKNKTKNANHFVWNLGDGQKSSLVSPMHTFNQSPGIFKPQLFATTIYGCKDSMALPSITVLASKAEFSALSTKGCFSKPFSFFDQSTNASAWLWSFGDGTTSTERNPKHSYLKPGLYAVTLYVKSNSGCSDSLYKPSYIEALGNPAFFKAPHMACAQTDISFMDSCLSDKSTQWFFGDGARSNAKNPIHAYAKPGLFTVVLMVEDQFGCSSSYTLPKQIQVNARPEAQIKTDNVAGCAPFKVKLQNHSKEINRYLWKFSDGDTSHASDPVHTFYKMGIYSATLTVTNSFGCKDSAVLNLQVKQTPEPAFSADILQGCSPFAASVKNTSTNLLEPKYLWRSGKRLVSTTANLNNTFFAPGFHTITLTVINANGCKDSLSKIDYLTVFDTLAPVPSKINVVSVHSNTSVTVLWEPSNDDDFDHYTLYRQTDLKGDFVPIGQISNKKTTYYIDTLHIEAQKFSYKYKVQTFDKCGNHVSLEALQAHGTINCKAAGNGTGIQVSWSPYIGAAVSKYEVYRMEGHNAPVLIGTTTSATNVLMDTSSLCPRGYSYRIKARGIQGNYISNSDTSMARPEINIFKDQKVQIVKTTVVNNESVFLEWQRPDVGSNFLSGYSIYRGIDDTLYSLLESVSSQATSFLDQKSQVNLNHYFYRIEALNTCNIKIALGDKSAPMLLKGEFDKDGNALLKWTPYVGWGVDIDYYQIEKQNDEGKWIILQKLDPSKIEFIDK